MVTMKIGRMPSNFHGSFSGMIERTAHVRTIERLLRTSPVVAILGARQVGKTTIARQIASRRKHTRFFDLERAPDLAQLSDPELALGPLRGLVVLDEIQRRPDLFPALRVLADRPRTPARFLVLGSASPDLLRQSSESLAGRIAHFELPGLSLRSYARITSHQLVGRSV
jgi:predicted AAA+ superfamily ATPase